MRRAACLLLVLVAVALRAVEETARAARSEDEARAMRGESAPIRGQWARSLWPDAAYEHRIAARRARARGELAAFVAAAADARSSAPRSWRAQRYVGEAMHGRGDESARAEAMVRALRCAPYHAPLQAAVGADLLDVAVAHRAESLALEACAALARAARLESLPWSDVFVQLQDAGVPGGWMLRLAGDTPVALHRLIEHAAAEHQPWLALAAGHRLDQPGSRREGEARAWVRLAVAARGRGDLARSVSCFDEAMGAAADPGAFALDHADALLEAGDLARGLERLRCAARRSPLSPERIEGSLRLAPSFEDARTLWGGVAGGVGG